MVVKSQTYKYQPKELTNTDKVLVSNPNQLTKADLESIKNALKVEYSTKNTDARLTSLKGTEVADPKTVVDTVTDSGSNLVVTYKDGSTDTIPKGTLIKSGNAPTVNMPRPASGGPLKTSILSTDNTITGTGTPGSKITIQVASAENGKVLKEITDIPVDASGNWTVTLENGLNSNVPVGGNAKAQNFFAPKNPVKVFETKDGIESASTDTYVSIGASKVLPSEASKDKASVVAGSKEVVLEVPHDAGISYFWYHDKETGKEVQIDIQRDKEVAENLGIKVADKDVDKVAIKSVTKGEFYNTITLEMKKNIKEGVVRIISHNNDGTYSSKAGKVSTPVTNEKPVVASVSGEDTTTVITNSQLNLLSLVKVTDHEDDQDATLGTKGTPRVVSVDGDTNVTEINTSEVGEHTVVYKTVDSQGKESDEYTHKVIVRENKVPEVSIPYSVDGKKDIYVYANEDIDIDLKFTDDSGKIKSATILQGGNNALNPVDKANPNVINNEYDTTFTQIDGETATTATEATPAIVKITGKMTKDTPGLVASKFPTDANGEYRVVTRYATSTDMDGGKIVNRAQGNSYATDPGAFALVIKAQTAKYDIKDPETKVPVVDANNVTDAEFNEIKKNIKIQYSTENPDKNLADKKGTDVENQDDHIESIEKVGNEVVVTYKDGSIDKKPLTDFARTNPAPTVELPYSNADKRQIYVYTGENTDLTFKASDDAALKKVYLRGPGNKDFDNTAGYGFTTGKINDGALESGEGTVASDKQNATIKMTGVTNLKAGQKWTSIIVAQDEDDARSINNFNSTEDFAERQQKPGYVEFIVKDQTSKYDIAAPTEKVAVTDPANVTDAELDKIKEKLQIEYSNNNDDANLADKKGKTVDAADAKAKIKSVTKDNDGKLVVTYTDGSTDKKPLSEFVTLDKQPAIDEVNKAAEKQIAAINSTPNATDEEKAAAIAKVNTDKQKALDEIAKPEVTTKDALDKAQTAGTGAIAKDNPVVSAKPEAKKAIDEAVKAKEAAIDARTDLTDDEKKAAKDAAKAAADKAKAAVDAATTDAEVTKAKEAGTKAVADVTPVAKAEAKKAIAKALEDKDSEIDKRTDLTDEEKAAAKEEAQAKAKEATEAINDQPANAETPEKAAEAQKAVDGAKDKGVADVKAVNPEAVTKPAAKKAIEDKLAKQLEDIANTPDATDEEKKVAADAAKALAEEAKEEIDNAKKDADVKGLQDGAEKEIEKSVPVVEDKPNARKAIDEEATAKKAEIDARNDLTPEAKAKLKAKVDKLAEKSKAAIDAVSSVDDVNTIEEADKAAIKAIGEVNRPIDKVLVKDPSALTDEEKAKILEEVKKVNPTAKEVKYDENGNIEVTTEAGDKGIINPTKLVKTEDQLDNGKGGNDINKPLDKVIVKDPSNLTDEEKAKIVAKVEEVNPDAIVTIDEDGTVSVSTPEGKTAAIPASELVRTKEDTSNPDAGNSKIVKPADKVAGEANDPDDQAKVEEKLRELNPETKSVKFDEDGNATVTLKDGTTATIPSEDLFKSEVDATKPNAGNDIVKPADKTVVANPEKLTDAEKKAIEDKVKAVNPDATVVVDDKGNATVTTPEGKTAVIPASDLTKSAADAAKPNAGNDIVKPADKTVVANPEKLTDAEKKAIEDKVKAVNPGATVVVDDKGNATVTTPSGNTAVIPAADLTKTADDAAKPNAGNDVVKPADKTVVANPEKLTDAEKKAIEDKVKAVNPGATVVVDDKGNATVTTPSGNTAVIPAADLTKTADDAAKPNAGNDVVKPADKTVVANPDKLTDAEKKAIEDKVKAVNPGATVVVDDKGNATVTTPEGKTAVIPATDLVKTQDDITKENAGNDVNTPAAKTVVANPDALTSEEKKAIEDKVKAVNPGSTVVVDDKGNATVAKGDGTVLNIPALDLVIPADDLADAAKNTAVKTPAIRTLVADKEKLTDAEKAAVKKAIEAVNPGATVVVDDKGNATVTLDGNTVSIAKDQLVKTASDVTAKNSGDNINLDFEKETVADLNNLTDAEKEAAKAKIKGANADVVEVIFDKAGNATVVTKDGKVLAIAAEDIFKQRPSAPNNGGNGTSGNNGTTNTDVKVDKAKLEGAIRQLDELIIKESAKLDAETAKEANDLLADAKKVFANADVSQAEVDAMVKRIEDFMAKVAPSTDHATPANDQAAQTPAVAPATTQAAANASQTASAQANTRKVAKELPNTGTADSVVSMVAAAASAVLGLGLAGRRRKEDEEA